MTKHTPGPWAWWDENTPGRPRPAKYDLCKLIGANGKVIISNYGGAGYEALGKTDEDIANAYLIAAARDMLDALEAEEHAQSLEEEYGRTARLLTQDERVEKWRDVEAARHHAGKLRAAALAKAKGQAE